jgi:CBS domain containing-hemolysin-like protein
VIAHLVLTIVGFVSLEALFSGSEMALVAANDTRLKLRADEGSKGAKWALRLLAQPEWLFATTQVGVTLCSVSNSVISTALLLQMLGPGHEWLAILILAPILLFFGQLLPKTLFRQHATAFAPVFAPVLLVAGYAFWPLVALGAFVSRRAQALSGAAVPERRSPYVSREEFLLLLGQEAGGRGPTVELRAVEKQLIVRMFSLTETEVREAMVPLIDVSAVSEDATVGEALEIYRTRPFSRLPVFRERVDEIVGTVQAFDLLGASELEKVSRFRRPVQYVPELKRTDELLIEMQRRRQHMAVVVDEYGGAVGIVTVEDLLEEIMGEIRDEFESEERRFVRLAENRYLANARMEIDQLNELLPVRLPKNGYETLAGLILQRLGRIPRPGETLREGRVVITVLTATDRAIEEVELTLQGVGRGER